MQIALLYVSDTPLTVILCNNLDSRALLRMTARERRALGNPDTNYVCDWFTTGTMKALVIGQFKYARKIELTVREALWKARLAWRKKKIVAMSEISKKRCKASLKTCRCCNSTLKKIFDSIDLFGKTAKKENLVEKLKDIGQIEVQEEDVNIRPTKMCRKCFRKITRLAKDVHAFRDICLKSKQIQEIK